MKFIKAEDARPGDEIIELGKRAAVRVIKQVIKRNRRKVKTPRYSIEFTDGSVSREVSFPQFLLVKRADSDKRTSKEHNRELRCLIANFLDCLDIDDEDDCSIQMLQTIAQAACDLREAIDERFCLSTGCGIKPHTSE